MADTISATETLNSYALFNATDVKSYIIDQLSNSPNPVFKGCSYMGSNMNALIDVLATISQQILFHFSVNTSEASFATASLYESMSKLVNILNYKTIGKQTSMLPIRFKLDLAKYRHDNPGASQLTIPRFTHVSYNSNYFLKNEIVVPIKDVKSDSLNVDSILFEGELKESSIYEANGDEFESFILQDKHINEGSRFISDNFFVVYVDETGNGDWREYTETTSLFLHDSLSLVYERRFNEDMNYEFKFGNGINGKKLETGAKVAIFYILSNGEVAILGDGVIKDTAPFEYDSAFWAMVQRSNYNTLDTNSYGLDYIIAANTGGGTEISYPETVDSIRANAPRIFSSQNRLFTLSDYFQFIQKNFSSYVKDQYLCTNDTYTKDYLRYYYNIGIDSPQEDSRLNIAQVEFMTSTNFNNVYCFIVPRVNTLIGGKIPNYLNNTLKHEIVNATMEYRGLTHNLVLLDPIYKAVTFGSFMDDTDWNANQLENRLVIIRNRLTKYSYTFIKDNVVKVLQEFFGALSIGSEINLAQLTKDLNTVPGVKGFYIRNNDGKVEKKMTLYMWNPLYVNEDNLTTQQNITNDAFVYPYFYDLDNIGNLIDIEDE